MRAAIGIARGAVAEARSRAKTLREINARDQKTVDEIATIDDHESYKKSLLLRIKTNELRAQMEERIAANWEKFEKGNE